MEKKPYEAPEVDVNLFEGQDGSGAANIFNDNQVFYDSGDEEFGDNDYNIRGWI